jgi:hypothetical protein
MQGYMASALSIHAAFERLRDGVRAIDGTRVTLNRG